MGEQFIDTLFKPCLEYKKDFNPELGDKHMVPVEYEATTTNNAALNTQNKILQ